MKANHFDFNKAFIHGVSSLRRNDEKRLLDDIEATKTHTSQSDIIEVNQNSMKVVKSAMDKVNHFLLYSLLDS